MKIFLVHHRCAISGVEVWLVELWRAFRALDHECELFFFDHGPMERQLPGECVAHFGDLEVCLRRVGQGRFDVVHADTTDWDVGIAAVRRLLCRPKLVVTAQSVPVAGWTSDTCDALVGCSAWLSRAQQAFTDLPVLTVQNGVDTRAFSPGEEICEGPPIVAWVGRGSDLDYKRIDRFAAMAAGLAKAGLRLWLADPDGPERVVPSAAATLRPIVEFWGPVPHEEMPSFFRRVAASGGCVVSTSSKEGLPFALLEAQACGCPVIGPATRGVGECVDPDYGGVLYAPGASARELGGLVLETIGDRVGMRWRRKACVQYARKHFSLERMAMDYLRVYSDAPYRPLGEVLRVGAGRVA